MVKGAGTARACTFAAVVAKAGTLTCAYSSKGTADVAAKTPGTGTTFSAISPTAVETDAEKKICNDASVDAADATISHCIYLEQMSCGLNRVTEDATGDTAAKKVLNLA